MRTQNFDCVSISIEFSILFVTTRVETISISLSGKSMNSMSFTPKMFPAFWGAGDLQNTKYSLRNIDGFDHGGDNAYILLKSEFD